MDITYSIVFAAGILSFLSPCVLPLVPPYLCYLTGISLSELLLNEDKKIYNKTLIFRSIFFVLGFSLVFIVMGASASAIRPLFNVRFEFLNVGFGFSQIAGFIILLFGFHFMGLFNLSFLNRNFSYQKNFKITGFSSSFLMGLVFGFGWTPCIGPVLASVLTLASVKESLYEGALLLSVYSLGLGIPFILSSLAINKLIKKIKKYKRYIHLVERMMGLILALTGIGFIFGWVEQSAYFLVENLTFLSIFGL